MKIIQNNKNYTKSCQIFFLDPIDFLHRRSVTGAWGRRPPPPIVLKITFTQTSRSAVYNKGKNEIGKNSVHKTFHKTFI